MELQYVYLLTIAVAFFPIWLVLFLIGKSHRKEMVTMGLLVAVLSFSTGLLWWTIDWWSPPTVTATKVGIEDLLLGFFAGGIMSAGYVIVAGVKKERDRERTRGRLQAGILLAVLLGLIGAGIWWGGLPSALSAFISLALIVVAIICVRPDLTAVSLGSGITTVLATLPAYAFLVVFYPAWIESTYPFEVLTGVRFYHIPVEEFIFWFLAGMVFGPFYKVWEGAGTRKIRRYTDA